MDPFWGTTGGHIVVGAVAGGVAALILPHISKFLKLGPKASSTIQSVGVVASAIVAGYVVSSYFYSPREITIRAADKAIMDAKANSEGKSASEVLMANSRNDANTQLDKVDSESKPKIAASQFMGFYFVNVKTKPEYCLTHGVQIPNFVNEFTHVNESELATARSILGMSMLEEEKFYQQTQEAFMKGFKFQIEDQASTLKVSAKQICEAIELTAKESAEELQFSKLMPVQANIIRGKS